MADVTSRSIFSDAAAELKTILKKKDFDKEDWRRLKDAWNLCRIVCGDALQGTADNWIKEIKRDLDDAREDARLWGQEGADSNLTFEQWLLELAAAKKAGKKLVHADFGMQRSFGFLVEGVPKATGVWVFQTWAAQIRPDFQWIDASLGVLGKTPWEVRNLMQTPAGRRELVEK